MAIKLHTGVPGTGKSLTLIDEVEHGKEYQGRRVLAHAIEGWIRATVLYCKNSGCRACRAISEEVKAKGLFVEDWQLWAQAGDLIVVDEAHYAFPSRREAKMPQYVERLTEHRHDGVDFWLCTPNANLMDINVRRLVEHHVHHVKGSLGRYRVSHTECMDSDDKLRQGQRENFLLPKRSYKFYKSADAHVTIKRALPRKVYVVAAAALAVPIMVGVLYGMSGSFGGRDQIREERRLAPGNDAGVVDAQQIGPGFLRQPEGRSVVSRGAYWEDPAVVDFRPRVLDIPASAPAYDRAALPVVYPPRVAGCIANDQTCVCYSQQATVMDVSQAFCRAEVNAPRYQSEYTAQAYWGSWGGGAGSSAAPAPPPQGPVLD